MQRSLTKGLMGNGDCVAVSDGNGGSTTACGCADMFLKVGSYWIWTRTTECLILLRDKLRG